MRFEIYIFDLPGQDGAMQAWAVGDYDQIEVLLSIPWEAHGCGVENDALCDRAITDCIDACERRFGGVLPWVWALNEEESRFAWTPDLEPPPALSARNLVGCRRAR